MSEGFPPLVLEMRAKAGELFAELGKVKAEVGKMAAETEAHTSRANKAFHGMAGAGKAMAVGVVGVGAVVGAAALKMGMDFQESMTTLITGAGESEKNIGMVGDGILAMSGKVGKTSAELASGMYLIESAGFHGAAGLEVLKAAAEGARVGNADMKTVADGVTTALTDYGLKAGDAATVTSKLVATVASGKTTMGALAGSLSNVLPTAKGAKVGLDQVLGAMATMTGQGISADQASQNLANTIRSLSAPSAAASHAMAQIGINSTDLAKNLGKKGLTGTLDEVYQAIMHQMGPSGLVLENSFNQSKLAAGSAKEMITQLPASLQKLAQGYLDGTVKQKDWTKALKDQPATVASLGKQFATVAKESTGFSDSLKSGSGSAHTFNDVLGKVMGGATGMNTALALTGGNMATFDANVKTISGTTKEADGSVKGFAETQKDLKVKLENAKDGVMAMVTKLGMALIPVVTVVLDKMGAFGSWLVAHKPVLYTFAGIVGGVVVTSILAYIASLVTAAVTSVASFGTMIGRAVTWAASTAASIGETIALWALYAAEGIGSAVSSAASGFASMIASGASWAAAQAVQAAKGVAAGAVWLAEHAVMFATAIAGYAATAAAATAAFIAENAATLGIVAVIGLLVAAIVWMATHWSQTWGVIKAVAGAVWSWLKGVWSWFSGVFFAGYHAALGALKAVWSTVWSGIKTAFEAVWNFVKGAFQWYVGTLFAGLKLGVSVLGSVWGAIWGGIKNVVSGAWSGIQTVFGWVKAGFGALKGIVQGFAGVWKSIWDGIGSALQWVYDHTIGPIVDTIKTAIGGVMSVVHGIGSVASSVGHFLGFANGGVIPGAPGEPRLIVGHGGEVVLSRDMLAGRQKPPPEMLAATTNAHGYQSMSAAALTGGGPSTGGGDQHVTVIAHTNASPRRIAASVGWELRAMA